MTEPCKNCDTEESQVFREGKVLLRFIRANKKPVGAMQNYKDGQTYWMYPRHERLPWWEPAEKIDFPIVEPATQEESVYEVEATVVGDIDAPAQIGPSGMTLQPSGMVMGRFEERPRVLAESPPKIEVEEAAAESTVTPSKNWKKKELVDYILSKGGFADTGMKKEWLIQIALNLA